MVLGMNDQKTIPNEIVLDGGAICNDLDMVLVKWKCRFFNNLFKPN